MKKLKIAIVGCGMIADAHVNQIRKIAGTHIVAACDLEPMMAEQLSERFDIPHSFSNLDKLLDQCQPDVVHILTPPATHFSIGSMALKAGCNVLIEKPFTTNSDDATALLKLAELLNRRIIVNHFHNFSPPSLRLKELVSQGKLGDILHMEGFYSYNIKSPVALSIVNDEQSWLHRLPGKLLHNNIDHLIAKFVEFIPDRNPCVWACAKQQDPNLRTIQASNIHDELRVMVSGKTTTAYATFSANISPFQHSMSVFGTKGTALVDYESRTVLIVPTSRLPGPFGKLAKPFSIGKGFLSEGIRNLIRFGKSDYHFYAGAKVLFERFYQCIRNNSDAPIPNADIIKVTSIMDDIFTQINEPIPLKAVV